MVFIGISKSNHTVATVHEVAFPCMETHSHRRWRQRVNRNPAPAACLLHPVTSTAIAAHTAADAAAASTVTSTDYAEETTALSQHTKDVVRRRFSTSYVPCAFSITDAGNSSHAMSHGHCRPYSRRRLRRHRAHCCTDKLQPKQSHQQHPTTASRGLLRHVVGKYPAQGQSLCCLSSFHSSSKPTATATTAATAKVMTVDAVLTHNNSKGYLQTHSVYKTQPKKPHMFFVSTQLQH